MPSVRSPTPPCPAARGSPSRPEAHPPALRPRLVPPAQSSPGLAPGSFPERPGAVCGAQTDRRAIAARHLRLRRPSPTPAAGPPRSRAPSPPRLPCAPSGQLGAASRVRTLSGPGLGCATTPEPPCTRHSSRRRRARLGPQPCELPLRRPVEGRSGGSPKWEGTGAVRPLPRPGSPLRPTPPARDPWTRDPGPGRGTPADLPLVRRLPLSRLPLGLRLQPCRSRAPPADGSKAHAVPAPPRRAGKPKPRVR